jgi:biopolymer transport protein ExbB
MRLWQIIETGGITMYVLLFCSILSLTVIIERLLYYRRRSKVKRADFMARVIKEIEAGNHKRVLDISRNTDTPFSSVVYAGVNLAGHNEKVISGAMEREIAIETVRLEWYTSIVGTIASTAVYIGLFGTVLGVIRAFRDISSSGASGINVVVGGISEALVCTAAGLCVAVPAVIAYNYFVKRIDNFVTDMELCASQVIDLICARHKQS